jgi:hypothetical protein
VEREPAFEAPSIRVWSEDINMDQEGNQGSLMQRLVSVEQQFALLKNEGKHLEALHYMEMSVFIRKQIYGDDRYGLHIARCFSIYSVA